MPKTELERCPHTATERFLPTFEAFPWRENRSGKSIVAEFDILVLYEQYAFFSVADNSQRMTLSASRIIISQTSGIDEIQPLVELLKNLLDGSKRDERALLERKPSICSPAMLSAQARPRSEDSSRCRRKVKVYICG